MTTLTAYRRTETRYRWTEIPDDPGWEPITIVLADGARPAGSRSVRDADDGWFELPDALESGLATIIEPEGA